jgi:hypothetical protein
MTLILDRLLDIPARPRCLRVHRTVSLTLDQRPADPFVPNAVYAHPGSGRWATSDGTLYTAIEPETAWYEYCRWQVKNMKAQRGWTRGIPRNKRDMVDWIDLGLPRRALVWMEFDLQRVPDLTTTDAARKLISAGFDPMQMRSDDHTECQQLAATAERLGWDALIVPSAAVEGRLEPCVPIFSEGIKTRLGTGVIAPSAGPSLFHAMNTRYRDNEKPSWLKVR